MTFLFIFNVTALWQMAAQNGVHVENTMTEFTRKFFVSKHHNDNSSAREEAFKYTV